MEDYEEHLRERISESAKKLEDLYGIMGSIIAGMRSKKRVDDTDKDLILALYKATVEVGALTKMYDEFFQNQEFKPLYEGIEVYSQKLEQFMIRYF